MKGKLLHILATVSVLCFFNAAIAQNYVSNSFDGTTFPPTGWTASIGSGSYNWVRTTTGITLPTTASGGLVTHTGSGMAGYNAFNAGSGSYALLITPSMNFSTYGSTGTNVASFWMWRDGYSYSATYDSVGVYINTSASLTGATCLGDINRYYTLAPAVSSQGWYQYSFTLPSSFASSSSVYFILKAYSQYGEDMEVDDVSVDHYAPCSGTVTAAIGRLTSAVCYVSPFTLTETSTSSLVGIHYQWQQGTTVSGPWTNISGATNRIFSGATLITGTGYFRCLDTCIASGTSAVSNVDTVNGTPCLCTPSDYYSGSSSPYGYYCNSYGYTYNACYNYNITYFSVTGYLGKWMHEGALSCATNCTADGANGLYDRTTIAGDTAVLQQGGNYNDTVQVSYGYYSTVGVWIDYNDNGVFEPSENVMIAGSGCSTYNASFPGTISVPLLAKVGYHRLRIRYGYDGSCTTPSTINDVDPCNYSTASGLYYYYGPARDYIVQVLAAPACSGTPTVSIPTSTSACKNTPYTVSATVAIVGGQGFDWQSASSASGPWTDIPGASSNIFTATPGTLGISYLRCVDTCRNSGLVAISGVDTVRTVLCFCSPSYYYSPGTSPYSYYCATYGAGSYNACSYSGLSSRITYFSIFGNTGSYIMDGAVACPSTCTNGYLDRTFDTVKVTQGGSYFDTITVGYGYYADIAVWIDYNDDGVFSNATEQVYLGGSYSSSVTNYPGVINVPLSANPGIHRMRVRYAYDGNSAPVVPNDMDPCNYVSATNHYFYGGTVRDYVINVLQAPPCTGAPSINVTPAGPISLCTGTVQTLIGNYTLNSGQNFQWMSSTNGGATWTNIAGATNTNYTFSMGTSNIMYMLYDSCAYTGLVTYSNSVQVAVRTVCPCTPCLYYPCYLYPGQGCSYNYYYVGNFQLNGATININDNYPGCNSYDYYDRTNSVAAPDLYQGSTYSGSVTIGYSTYYYETVQIWIDFNDNGVFETSEAMLSTPLHWYASTATKTYSISIPACANTGKHLMRMRNVYCGTSASISAIDPCVYYFGGYYYYYGNAMDYYVNVLSTKTTPTISPYSNLSYCSGANFTLTASSTSTSPTPAFKWTLPNGSVVPGSTVSVSGATFANNGIYKVQDTSGGCPSAPAYDTINVWTTPTFTAGYPNNNGPVCTPNALQLFGGANPPNSVATWSGPSSYSSSLMNPVVANPTTAATAAGLSGTYTISVNNHGCTNSASTTALVKPTPNVSNFIAVNPTTCTCNCGSITLQGLTASTTYTLNYTRNGTAITPVSITSNASGNILISNLSAAIYNNITLTLNGCPSPAVGPITINNPSSPPPFTATSNAPLCYGTNLNFTGTTSTSLTWTWSGPGTTPWSYSNIGATSNPSKSSVTFADSGNYLVYVTDANLCTSPIQTIHVVVKPLPNTPTLSTNAPAGTGICTGNTLTITGATTTPPGTIPTIGYAFTDPTGGAWSTTAGTATLSVPNVPTNFAGTWTVYSTLNGCNSASPATIYTYIKWKPGVPTVNSNSPVCAGNAYNPNLLIFNVSDTSTATATALGTAVNYVWTGPAAIVPNPNAQNADTITNPSASAAGTYTVYANLLGCTSATASTTVTINASPVAPVVNPTLTKYCQYDITAVPLAATGTSLRWYTASTGGLASTTAPTPSTTVAGVYLWYVTQTNASNCESPAAQDTVLVKTKPPMPYAPVTAFTYCQGDNASLLVAIGANLQWYTTATGGVGTAAAPTPSTATPGSFTYYVSQTVNGCESDRLSISILVKAKPPKPGSPTKQYCQNDFALPLTASGSNLLWYRTSTGGPGSAIAPTPVTSYADTSYYYVTQTVNGCESDRTQVMVVVNYTPNALIVANTPYVCQYDSTFFTYFGNATSAATFDWAMPTGATLLHGNDVGPIWVKFDSSGKRVISLQVTNKQCKSPVTTYIVDVREAPYAPTNIKDDVCQGQTLEVSLGYANEQIDKFDWNFDGAEIVYGTEGGGPYGIRWSTSGQHIVEMVAWTNSCPSIPIYDTVNVHPLADAHIGDISNSNICAGDSVMFTAERYNPAYLYQWQPAIYFGTQTNQGQVYGYVERSGYITLNVTTEFGCTSTDSALISAQPCCEMYFPNAFTPNGDGKNDVFRPISKGNQIIKTFRVTNRWGQVMFETVNPKIGWDGKFNGVVQDLGTYYYYIKYACANGKVYEEKGEVLLIK